MQRQRVWVSILTLLPLAAAACASKPACENDTLALVMAHDFVGRQLKSPSSASYPTQLEEGVTVIKVSSDRGARCAFLITTYVDADNSFGASIRTPFIVKLSPDDDSGKSWSLESIAAM